MWRISSTIVILLLAMPAAAQNALSHKDLDAKIDSSLYEVLRLGTYLFNTEGNEEACFHVYEGALRVVVPLLDHHPDVQKKVMGALARAIKEDSPQRSFTLRAALDDVREVVKPKPATAPMNEPKKEPDNKPAPTDNSLWARLGGEIAVRKVVHDFVAAAAMDPKIDVTRGGKFKVDAPRLEQLLVEQISSVSGGPLAYTGRDMKTVHKGMMITEAEFNAAGELLIATLKKHKVGQKEIDELMMILGSTKKDIVEMK